MNNMRNVEKIAGAICCLIAISLPARVLAQQQEGPQTDVVAETRFHARCFPVGLNVAAGFSPPSSTLCIPVLATRPEECGSLLPRARRERKRALQLFVF